MIRNLKLRTLAFVAQIMEQNRSPEKTDQHPTDHNVLNKSADVCFFLPNADLTYRQGDCQSYKALVP